MVNADVISMPDKWEYPWYAAWDLAFHAVALATVDIDFAKAQLELMLREMYLHPSGQIPAYEWNFSDVNPPVHAWATIFLHRSEQALHGRGDVDFLKRSFGKLLANFTWWVNRKDRHGKNVFEGGFLGLDNIGVFDRSAPLPTGGYLEQADGTAWMALFCQNMLEIAVEIASEDPTFEDMAVKFVDHFLAIGNALNRVGQAGMWDEEDGFYYDVLRLPDGSATRLKVRSLVGLLPLCATTVIEPWQRERVPKIDAHFRERDPPHAGAAARHPSRPARTPRGYGDRGIMAVVNEERLRRILEKMLDEQEFLSPYGIRALSRVHEEHPYVFHVGGRNTACDYLPAESDTGMFGGNSNWRGPIWMPMNVLLIRALLQFYMYYGDAFTVECPDRIGPPDEPVRGGPGDRHAADPHLPARRARPPSGVRRHGDLPDRSALAGSPALLRVLPRRQRRRPRRQPSDRLDRARRHRSSGSSARPTRTAWLELGRAAPARSSRHGA